MRSLPVLSVAAAAALLASTAGPAAAATAEPAAGFGNALSTGSLVKLTGAGVDLEALRVSLPTSTSATGGTALVSVHPLVKDGQDVLPAITVSPGDGSKSLPSQTAGVPGVLELASPTGSVSALLGPAGPVAKITSDVGQAKLIGLDLLGDGSFATTSGVTKTVSSSSKTLQAEGLALPTLLEILDALGLDVSALPTETLVKLLELVQLPGGLTLDVLEDLLALLEDPAASVEELLAAADDVAALLPTEQNDAITSLVDQLAALEAAKSGAESSSEMSSSAALPGVGDVIDDLTGGGASPDLGTGTLGDVLTLLPPELVAELEAVLGDLEDVDLQELIDTLTEILNELLKTVLGLLPIDLLDVSLLSIGAIDVTTLASTGATDAATVTGTVSDVRVLDNQLVDLVDIRQLLGAVEQLEGTINDLLGQVTDVLGEITGLVVPLPQVQVLTVVEKLTEANGVKTAQAGVDVLSLSWAIDELAIPTDLLQVPAVPASGMSAQALPGGQLAALTSGPLAMTVGSLADTSSFRTVPGPTAGGGGGSSVQSGSQLPRTGGPALAAAVGLTLLAGAALARRRQVADPAGE